MRWAWFGVLVAASSASCMFFRSLDDLSAERAGTSASEGGTNDADIDGADANGSESSSGDAGTDGDTGVSRVSPCFAGHSFTLCNDFDDGGLTDGFDGEDRGSAGALELSAAQAASPPRSVFFENPTRAAGDPELRNALTLEKSGAFARATLEFDIFLAAIDQSVTDFGGAGLAVILFRTDNETTGTVLARGIENTGLSVENTTPSSVDYFSAPPITIGKWVHVSLDFKRSGTFDYSIDGQTGQRTFAAVALSGSSPRVSLSLGLHTFDSPAVGMSAYYDNVVLRFE